MGHLSESKRFYIMNENEFNGFKLNYKVGMKVYKLNAYINGVLSFNVVDIWTINSVDFLYDFIPIGCLKCGDKFIENGNLYEFIPIDMINFEKQLQFDL